jgi:hypothetical protein
MQFECKQAEFQISFLEETGFQKETDDDRETEAAQFWGVIKLKQL